MSKFTTTLKGLMALALGSFSLGASADVAPTILSDAATIITAVPGEDDNRAIYVIQSQARGGLYYDTDANMLTACANPGGTNGLDTHGDVAISGNDTHQQFAIITCGGVKYLYSVAGNCLISSNANKGVGVTTNNNTTAMEMLEKKVSGDEKKYFRITINTNILNHSDGYEATYKGIYLAGSADDDAGNRYLIQKLNNVTLSDDAYNEAISVIQGEVATAKTTAIERLTAIKQFYHNPTDIEGYIAQVNAAFTAMQVNQIVSTVYDSLNGKLVYMLYANRENENDYKYLGVIGVGNYRIAQLLPERGNRAKWKLERVPNEFRFRLTNIASDTYITASGATGNNGQTVASGSGLAYFEFEFKTNTAVDGAVTLKFSTNDYCLTVADNTIGGTTYPYSLKWSAKNPSAITDAANAWKLEPVGMSPLSLSEIPAEGEYVVIRSNRGLTGTVYDDSYPGSLLGVYTPDREKARRNQSLSTGVHLRQFLTGMQTIWKIVPQPGGGFKIYSIMGEDAEGNPSLGMHYDGSGEVYNAEDPTVIYIRSVSQWSPATTSPLPYGVALCSDATATEENNCFDVRNTMDSSIQSDFYVKANTYRPNAQNATSNLGSVFYVERVSQTDVAAAKAAFIDYAANNRMFELLKNVLTPEEKVAALAEKTIDASTIDNIEAARNYLNDGEHAASTLAFEKLNGKTVRFVNRQSNAYMNQNDGATTFNCTTDNSDANLRHLWTVEVVNAGLRQIRLKNYADGKYLGVMGGRNAVIGAVDGTTGNPAGIYTVSRYYSLDGKSFYMNLFGANGNYKHHAVHHASEGRNDILVWTAASLASHWTMMNAVADDVKNTQIDLTINAKGDLISIKPAEGGSLTKTANFPAAYTVKLTPKAAATPADAEATTPTEVVVPEANITAATDGSGFEVNLAGLNVPQAEYTLNFPVGYFTANGKLAPALSKDVKVEDTTGIREVNAAEKGAEVIYDLQGRRVSKAGKGVYIINGVKTLVK